MNITVKEDPIENISQPKILFKKLIESCCIKLPWLKVINNLVLEI